MDWFYISKNTSSREILLDNIEEILEVKDEWITCKKREEGWGVLSVQDEKTLWKIEPIYMDAGSYSEGLFPCRSEEKWGFLDANGKTVLPFKWDYVYSFSSGLAAAAQGEKWGVINRKGEWIVSPSADYLRSYSDGLAVGRIRGTWFVLDLNGKSILTPSVQFIRSFNNGLAAFNKDGALLQSQLVMGGKWGFLDKKGGVVIPPQYNWVGNFISDYAPYYKESKDEWGLLSKRGEEMAIAGVSAIREFSDGLILAEKNGLWGFLNFQRKEVIPCVYSEAKPFVNGTAFVLKENPEHSDSF